MRHSNIRPTDVASSIGIVLLDFMPYKQRKRIVQRGVHKIPLQTRRTYVVNVELLNLFSQKLLPAGPLTSATEVKYFAIMSGDRVFLEINLV